MLTQTSPRVIVNSYGSYYPGIGYGHFINSQPLRTEVVSSPEDYLVTLDQSREWVSLVGTNDADENLLDLLQVFSDHICGPHSITCKCFRKWRLADVFSLFKVDESSRISLSYPVVQSIENIKYIDNDIENIIDPSKYRLCKAGLKRSAILFLDNVEFTDEEHPTELIITYNASADLDSSDNPIIDKRLILATKYYINDAFYKRGIQLGPFEGAGVENKVAKNLLKSFMY